MNKVSEFLEEILNENEIEYVLDLTKKEQQNLIMLDLVKEKKYNEIDIINYMEKNYDINIYFSFDILPNSNILKDALGLNLYKNKQLNLDNEIEDIWFKVWNYYNLNEVFTLNDLKVWAYIAKEKLKIKNEIDFSYIRAYFFSVISCPFNYPLASYSINGIYNVLDRLNINHGKIELNDSTINEDVNINIYDYFNNAIENKGN
jgi:hypothetical protein